MRFGFSITTPYGMGKRWPSNGMDNIYPATFASKFELRITDFNPTVTYAVTDKLSVAGGLRLLYGSATLMSGGIVDADPETGSFAVAGRALSGDAWGWGYNLAIDYKASKEWNFAATYRSKADLNFSGDTILASSMHAADGSIIPNAYLPFALGYNAVLTPQGKVTVIAPAVFALSTAYSWDKFTLELTVDRTFWSAYNQLNFSYDQSLAGYPILGSAFGPVEKNWKDANAIRLGLAYNVVKPLTLMAGLCYDHGGAPESTLGFELPDSDAWVFSLGARYAVTDRLDLGVGVLYDSMNSHTVPASANNTQMIDGKFSDAAALLVTAGIQYRF
jgi:long-chain fatty acid transport protein